MNAKVSFTIWLSALILLCIGTTRAYTQEAEIRSVAEYLSHSLSAGPRRTIAVVDFNDLQNNVTPLGRFMAEELESALANSGAGLDLVDRTRLQLLLQENKLASTGIIDPATARKLGKIAGVQVLITGTITPLENTVRLSLKAIDSEDARVLAATSKNIVKTRDIAQLLGVTSQPMVGSSLTGASPATETLQTQSTAAATQVTQWESLAFALKSCARSGKSVKCFLTITNRGDDQEVWFQNARSIDSFGRAFWADQVKVGTGEGNRSSFRATLVQSVPTVTELRFELPSDASSIALLEMSGQADGHERFHVQFRHVVLSTSR